MSQEMIDGMDVSAERMDLVGQTLRQIAGRAAECWPGARSLVFAHLPDEEIPAPVPALRAAAGFRSAAEARAVADEIRGDLIETMDDGSIRAGSAPGDVDPAALLIPIVCEERVHGVLWMNGPAPEPENTRAVLVALAQSGALRIDHAVALARLSSLENRVDDDTKRVDEKSDEILKLSEALFAQDIELLESSERLGKVEKLKNDFIEKMSRELRTPLNGIIEAIISVLAGENEALSEGAKESLRHALDDGTSFLRTLQNILDLWRIKQREMPIERQEVNFREVVEEAIFSVQDFLDETRVEIHTQVEEPLPKIRTDLAKVNQVLFLLLDNAVKFTPHGRIDIGVRVEGEQLVCTIEDSGIGICPDDQQFIFDEFHQVDELSSTKYMGSGLGLALVRDLLALLEGEVEVRSEVGEGSSFTFRVPVEVIG